MLAVAGLSHSFARRPAEGEPVLDIASFEAVPGELTVLTGPSGSGKTTLLYALSGLLKPATGSVTWDDVDIAALGEGARDRWRLENAGFVFQDFHLFEDMTPLGNVTVAATFRGFAAGAAHARAKALLERFGVPAGTRRADSFSRGEQQRIALARALVFDPKIVFADEPTASLDAAASAAIASHLAELAADGKTVIAVSHDPALIALATRVLRLERGRLADPRAMAA